MEAGKFRNGSIFRMEGSTYVVLEYSHIQQPRLAPFVRAKIKNVETGAVQEKRFNVGDYFDDVELTRRQMQFSYNVDTIYTFMDSETFDQVDVDANLVKDAMQYHTDGASYTFTLLDDKVIGVTPETFVILTVTETEPSVAGDTARSAMKNAKLESGITVKVPMFVNNGDRIKVDTRNGTYAERA